MTKLNGLKEPHNKVLKLTARGRHALCLGSAYSLGLHAKVAPVTLRAVRPGHALRPCSQLSTVLYGRSKKCAMNGN